MLLEHTAQRLAIREVPFQKEGPGMYCSRVPLG